MKKLLLISFLIIAVVLIAYAYQHAAREAKLEIVDLARLPSGERKTLLEYMTTLDRDGYDQRHAFQLDDKDPSTKVVIGTYRIDDEKPGGIIMLKRLPNGQDAIYWEIASPLLTDLSPSIQPVRDINGDGFKEIVILWNGPFDLMHVTCWIITIDPRTKTYKVLNNVIDEKKNLETDLNFEHPDPSKQHLNRFQVILRGSADIRDLIRDIDNDGIAEIVLTYPALEWLGDVRLPQGITTNEFTQIYKWDAAKREYFLWKEAAEKISK